MVSNKQTSTAYNNEIRRRVVLKNAKKPVAAYTALGKCYAITSHRALIFGRCFEPLRVMPAILTINVIIETTKGSQEKYDYDEDLHAFKLKKILPAGMSFPYDFGFIPGTKGDDGDPLDVIVISEFKSFTGCMVECRIIGCIQANQTDKKETVKNDRFVGVPVLSATFGHIKSIKQLPKNILTGLQNFFINYNTAEGRIFKPTGNIAAAEAMKLINAQKNG